MKNQREQPVEEYLKIIDEIEDTRARNNVNWMDILRIAFTHAPEDAKEVMRKINGEDSKVAALLLKLTK